MLSEMQVTYPYVSFTDLFLVIDGSTYVGLEKIASYSVGQYGTEYYL